MLTDRKKCLLIVHIDQDLFESFVEVESFSGNVLAIPNDFARVRVEGEG